MFAHWQYACLIPLLFLFACIKDQDPSSPGKLLFQYSGSDPGILRTIAVLQEKDKVTPFADSLFRLYGKIDWDKGVFRISAEGSQKIFPFSDGMAAVENLLVIDADQDNAIATWSYRQKWLQADKEQRKPFGSLLSVMERLGQKVPDNFKQEYENSLSRRAPVSDTATLENADVAPYDCTADISWSYIIAIASGGSDPFEGPVRERIRSEIQTGVWQFCNDMGWLSMSTGLNQVQVRYARRADFAVRFSVKLHSIILNAVLLHFPDYNPSIGAYTCDIRSSCAENSGYFDDPQHPSEPNPHGPGGPPPVPPFGGDTLQITNEVEHPCLKAVSDSFVRNFQMTPFLNNMVGMMINDTSILINLTDTVRLDPGVDGETLVGRNGPYYNVRIKLNAPRLARSSQENIAVTLMHEFLHAYIRIHNLAPGSLEHEYMATHYLNEMANALRYHYGTPQVEAIALAWGGLQGTNAWNSLPAAAQANYTDIQRDHRYSAKGKPCGH